MSLRAIQKRDRNKLSAQAQATKQHHQAFINNNSSGANKIRTLGSISTATSPSGGHHHHHHHHHHASSGGNPGKNDKWRNSNGSLSQSSSLINYSSSNSPDQPPLTSKKRSVSYPTLAKKALDNSHANSLRFTKSESDLQSYCTGAGGPNHTSSNYSANSQNNLLYLGAKSEVCLKTLAVKSTHQPPAPFRNNGATIRSGGGRMYESNRRTSDLGSNKFAGMDNSANNHAVRIPIIGYEVMEERARFTIFKLRIENSISHSCWLVLRRYTDFVRLNNKLRTLYPHCQLVLPRKKWFGDNFSSGFIDNRIQGLQTFINTIMGDDAMRTNPAVREFFCLDEPPAYSESMEESRIIFEAQEETISHLKQQLQTKDELVAALQAKLASEINRNKVLTTIIRNSFESCPKCATQLDNQLKESTYSK
ncbi:uncharacterized protein LOC129751355 [Uranotaenia lowii]|uniref:uncharacterized protein LOC129751355 n=1 Tax=Uranotaenia lowii TaxID=190385 RepID=UPI002479D222|nr:uncharacterized protein LOC129751355 [Uranotaenia lowii]XP_055602780.1 uncharacterized protein LOC129751355 [Uranotaenia lowii]XP_055602781.1 uncharacterized protein LOC129751355 [Uranotaenia lowii]